MSGSVRSPQAAGSAPASRAVDLQRQERLEEELIMHLERDQFVAETSRPVPRARSSARAPRIGLWALRVFVVLVSLMVIYTFIDSCTESGRRAGRRGSRCTRDDRRRAPVDVRGEREVHRPPRR
jgi:hypothetical protein